MHHFQWQWFLPPGIYAAAATSLALAQPACPEGQTCLSSDEAKVFVELLKEKKCLQTTQPSFKLDPITITTDVEGRVYYSGSAPQPYKLHYDWCNYSVDTESKIDVKVAKKVPSDWGFRFRMKAYVGFLFIDALEKYPPNNSYDPSQATDLGVQVDFFHWQWLNVNVGAGLRSANFTLGADLTKNFGIYAGYAFSFWTLKHNPTFGVSFALW